MGTKANSKKWFHRCIMFMMLLQLTGCAEISRELYAQARAAETESESVWAAETESESTWAVAAAESEITEPETVWNYYNPDGMTLTTRINTPEGYTRPEAEETSLAYFLLNYPLKAFLLAQGHMPAQEFQVAKNPNHPDDPWYYEDEVVYPFETLEYTFPEECLQRLTY